MSRILMIVAALGLAACTPTTAANPPSTPGGGGTVFIPGSGPPQLPMPDDGSTPLVNEVQPSTVVDKAADALGRANVAVDRAWAAYVSIRNVAGLVTPYLSADRQARIRAIEATIEGAFARARAASDLAVQAAELARAAQSARLLEGLTVDFN